MTKTQNAIVSDPDIQGGTPVFAGTRVPVQILIDYLGAGESVDEFLAQFPSVSRELAEAALRETRAADRQAFRRRVIRLIGTTVTILSWGPPDWPCRGRAITVRGFSWEAEVCDGKPATARIGWRLPRSIWHVDLIPRIRLDVCSDHSASPSAANTRKRSEGEPAAKTVKTAYDRMFAAKMDDPEWAAGYRRARARLDGEDPSSPTIGNSRSEAGQADGSETAKPRRRIHRWEDIRREPRPR
jgi:uncharacterized protein (DUF433 family)